MFRERRRLAMRHRDHLRREGKEVIFHSFLVLRRWRNDFRVTDESVAVDLISMVERAARRLGASVANPRSRAGFNVRLGERLVALDYPDRLVERVDDLDRAHQDTPEWIRARDWNSRATRRTTGGVRQQIEVEAEAGNRSAQVRPPFFDERM